MIKYARRGFRKRRTEKAKRNSSLKSVEREARGKGVQTSLSESTNQLSKSLPLAADDTLRRDQERDPRLSRQYNLGRSTTNLAAEETNWSYDDSPTNKANLVRFQAGSPPPPLEPGFSNAGIVPDDVAGRRVFLGDLPFPSALSFRRRSVLTSLRPRRLSRPRCQRVAQISPQFTRAVHDTALHRSYSDLTLRAGVRGTRVPFHLKRFCPHLEVCALFAGGAAEIKWLDYSPPTQANQVRSSGGATPGFSRVGIVLDYTVSRRVFSEISRFPRPLLSGAVPLSPRFILIGSQDLDVTSRQ
ncbi:hypothetical protein PR048_023039 [Dryococelus australis]|uniref:Uncharacterized protein n=1 Tax=Dryococelus australis TaxID=614101 RepID=A0ABQ9GSY1_9NEOP|nr:hypothetical protein PR048_023039 [Dryococelus australis]